MIDSSAERESPVGIPAAASNGGATQVSGGSRVGRTVAAEGDLSAAAPAPHLLRAKDIGASIDNREVLAGIDLELAPSAALAVVGVSGAGKTTLARVVAGLHRSA